MSGASPSREALLQGRVEVLLCYVSEAVWDVRDGRMRALGQMADERDAAMPDVPTFCELS